MYVTRYKEGLIRDSLSLAIQLFLRMLVSILSWFPAWKPEYFSLFERTLRRDELKRSDAGEQKDMTKIFALTGSIVHPYDGARRSSPISHAQGCLVLIGQGAVPWAVATKYHCPQPALLCLFLFLLSLSFDARRQSEISSTRSVLTYLDSGLVGYLNSVVCVSEIV